jgi:LmbE family N-acetylglucosaminyl deacetylase
MKIMVIAPHPDDEAIGCGGAICLHVKHADRVSAVFLTSGELGIPGLSAARARTIREAEARESAKILGITKLSFLRQPDGSVWKHLREATAAIRPILERQAPSLIYLPHPGEWHPDHRVALTICRAALQQTGLRPALRTYEVWTPLAEYDAVENISAVMPRKLSAIRCHRSQLAQLPYDRAIQGLDQYRGAFAAQALYAEVFQVL